MILYLRKEFKDAWKNKDPFEEVDKLQGKVYRLVKTRRTLQFEFNGKSYFAKIHHGVGWREIFKNFVQIKTTILGADNEFNAIRKLESLDIGTMNAAAFGKKGHNPATQDSFIITDDIQNCISLEDFTKNWNVNSPLFNIKLALINKVAWVSRQLHTNGVNHRDYYICHFLLDPTSLEKKLIVDSCQLSDNEHPTTNTIHGRDARATTGTEPRTLDPKLFVIDLHRAQIRKKTPHRWIVKDVAGIWFSAMNIGLTKKDIFRFIKIYSNDSLKNELNKNLAFWKEVNSKAIALYRKEFKKKPDCVFSKK